jgi:hypothetical protein
MAQPYPPGKNPMRHVPGRDEPPDPAMSKMVREALGIKEPKPPREDTRPGGLSDVGTAPILKMPEPTVFHERGPRPADETTPAFGNIEPVTQASLMKMLPWLAPRLTREWPGVSPNQWHFRLQTFLNNAGFYFRQSRYEGCALAYMAHDQFGPKLWIGVLFNVGREADCFQLFRDMIHWGQISGLTEIRHIDHTDVPEAKLNDLPGFKKREELVVKIK